MRTESTGKYRWVIVPDHPMADKRGRVLEHRYVMSQYLGRLLTKEEKVHHKDENKLNNDISNLELMENEAQHRRKHHPNAWVTIECEQCGKKVLRSRRNLRGKHHFCSTSCSTTYCLKNGLLYNHRVKQQHIHGTEARYRYKKCRCSECKAAHAKTVRNWRNKHQDVAQSG